MNLRKKYLIISIIFLGLAGWLVARLFWLQPDKKDNLTQDQNNTQQLLESINGVLAEPEIAQSRPLAVMVENHPDARPQSGLSEADIVYETLAEGGITRFLAIFQSQEAKNIGPVRSAREYFAQIADEWGALYAHVGGSNEVIRQLKQGVYQNLSDANEYYNFEFFPRKKDKPEPHHIFTSSEKLRELIAYHNYANVANFQPWIFKEDSPVATSSVVKISIDFSRAGYEAGWIYDAVNNSYLRSQYFKPHLDANTGEQIKAKNVVIQIAEITPVLNDPLLQVDINLQKGGRAIIFQDGIVIEGVWKKVGGITRYYNSSNVEIKFNRGLIWVEIVPKEKESNLIWK